MDLKFVPPFLASDPVILTAYRILGEKPRKGWVDRGVRPEDQETVLQHKQKLARAAQEFYGHVDPATRDHAVLMAWTHDLAEYDTPDYTPHDAVAADEKHRQESAALDRLFLGVKDRDLVERIHSLWMEYEKGMTDVAKIVKQLDKADPAVQVLVYRGRGYPEWPEFLDYSLKRIENQVIRTALLAAHARGGSDPYAVYFSALSHQNR